MIVLNIHIGMNRFIVLIGREPLARDSRESHARTPHPE